MQSRRWLFTDNTITAPADAEAYFVGKDKVKVAVCQLEKVNHEHLQGYVVFDSPVRLAHIKRIWPSAHAEPCNGDHESCVRYCTKDESRLLGPWWFPDEPSVRGLKQGRRSDLREISERIVAGASLEEIANDHPDSYVRYHRGFEALLYSVRRVPERVKPLVILCQGGTGTGKSRWCKETLPDAYWKPPGKWWNGYAGERMVVIDDFDTSDFPYRVLLRVLDRYPMQVETKGGFRHFSPEIIAITSSVDVDIWYPGHLIPELKRRIDATLQFPKDKDWSLEEIKEFI